ncbi:MAG TPA: cobalamin-dependent protein [Thermoleophilia bacterium]|nr:cobalamin-dependent protein [Thermoleophilia bacterium]
MTFDSLQQAVIAGEAEETARLVQQHLDEGADALDILDNGLIAAMDKVGAMFSAGDLFIPEMLVSAEAMQEGLGLLKPLLLGRVSGGKGTVVMGAVKGDLHDIGKNLVVLMLEGAGFTVVDLGNDVAPEAFVAAAKEHEAVVVGMSALLVTTMPQMKITVEQLRAAGLAAKAIVGGAPLTQAYADEIAADGYASDAPGAVVLCKSIVA